MNTIKILAVNDIADLGTSYTKAFDAFNCEFRYTCTYAKKNINKFIEWADVILYCGGSDLSTALYRQPRLEANTPNINVDLFEIGIYNYARKLEKIQIGICRGFQFLSVMNGYRLLQHIDGHEGVEHVILYDYEQELVNSYHHQGVTIDGIKIEEYFKFNEKDIGVQWHPELGGNSKKVFQKLLKDNFYLFYMDSK